MVKISSGERGRYFEKIKPFQARAAGFLKKEQEILETVKTEGPSSGAAFKRLGLAEDMFDLTSNYILIDAISWSMLRVKNWDALNEGRKSLFKGIVYLEEITGRQVDAPFSEYEERLVPIRTLDGERRYRLIRKGGLTIQLLEGAFGDHTRWKWAFVEPEGRLSAAAKNIMDLRAAAVNTDPRSPEYEPTVRHLRLVKKLLARAADRYRNRYELSTGFAGDFERGIEFLAALRRIHLFTGDQAQAELVKKQMDSWSLKLRGDLKKRGAPVRQEK